MKGDYKKETWGFNWKMVEKHCLGLSPEGTEDEVNIRINTCDLLFYPPNILRFFPAKALLINCGISPQVYSGSQNLFISWLYPEGSVFILDPHMFPPVIPQDKILLDCHYVSLVGFY